MQRGSLQARQELDQHVDAEFAKLTENFRRRIGDEDLIRPARLRQQAVSEHRRKIEQELVKAFDHPDEQVDLFYAALLLANDNSIGLETIRP